MADYALSYVLTTYNKLPYLKQVLERLIAARQPDEEIVVADGGSKDGTPEYLRQLHEAGLIQQFVSERDKGEAHGFNKCMLMARGELIKLITDDDAFCYPAIREAKQFMLTHPEVDVLSGNTGLIHLENLGQATLYDDVADNFRRWLEHKEVVWMIGLPLLIRRTSLALTGLFHTGVVQVDTEFTYRITSLNVNLAWSTAMLSTRIENPQSNFRVMNQGKGRSASDLEADRMRFYYDKTISNSFRDFVRYKSGWSEMLKAPLRPVKRKVFDVLNREQYQGNKALPTGYTGPALAPGTAPEEAIGRAFEVADGFMASYNAHHPTKFLARSSEVTKVL
ncbi:glycosyltransferase family 2 protein [Microvirga sp. STR05]|uniref:Glycosyltransferase family 2 protein n=1 Tax=Hymenobacter duratus TaxID=2771356 RepID=A0ABR8JLQ9_9BACT|nr:glycosyltransferase family A protein [Hymenobacter duratus]MBD2715724.1 glycosyltransferase family 2 protein [Hymenobacter duratus]MBR7950635.1 glycosyltransferase family 2 protein [Microvirga sp. STR05]